MKNVGYRVSHQTVGNILTRHNLLSAPERKQATTWREFIRFHWDLLVATDFFTTEVWIRSGLVTYYILFFIQVSSRKVHIAGWIPNPDGAWIIQMIRNATLMEWGFLTSGQHLIHDHEARFCLAFQNTIKAAGITPIKLPPRSPNLNAHTERWIRSIKGEALSKLILFGEGALRWVLQEYGTHYHQERNHQGKGHELLMPQVSQDEEGTGSIHTRERLGGLLKYDYRTAA